MNKRYTDEERLVALEILAQNGGDFAATSAATGVSLRTLRRWDRQERKPGVALRRVQERYRTYRAQAQTFENPYQQFGEDMLAILMDDVIRLADSNEKLIDDAPLNQRVAALNAMMDKIFKLRELLPPVEDKVIRVEFVDCDGTVHETPYWSRSDPDEQGTV